MKKTITSIDNGEELTELSHTTDIKAYWHRHIG